MTKLSANRWCYLEQKERHLSIRKKNELLLAIQINIKEKKKLTIESRISESRIMTKTKWRKDNVDKRKKHEKVIHIG